MFSDRKYYFMTIAETLNITRAAEMLYVTQPALTQYLNKLEKTLDIRLVDRSFTPLRLTDAGKTYYEHLKRQKAQEKQLFKELDRLRSRDKKPLAIGIPLQKSHDLTRVILPEFLKKHPEVGISIWEGTSTTVKQAVIRGELEIGFAHTFSAKDEDFDIQLLNPETVVIICNRKNPIVGGRESSVNNTLQIDPALLNDQLFFQMSPEYFLYDVEMQQLKLYNVNPARRLVISNLQSVANAVVDSESSGFAYMPDFVLSANAEWAETIMPHLAFIRLGKSDLDWYFAMLRKKGAPLSPEGKLFWKCVADLYK